jgi:hypothetical protein
MDSYETINYSKITTNQKIGKRDRLNDDKCGGLTKDECQSTLPLKYMVNDFFENPCVTTSLTNLSRGINFNSSFGPSINEIDLDTQYRIGKFGAKKECGSLPSYPMCTTGSFTNGQGNVLVEDRNIRATDERVKKSCNDKDNSYYNRSFYIFPDGVTPNPIQIDCIVQQGPEYRQGVSVKGSVGKSYKRGKFC